jgi:uncharacterized protein YbaR (Trm112 family)
MISKELLDILVCPESRTPLALAEGTVVERLNQAIQAGQLRSRCGQKVERRLDGGLVRQDGTLLYPIIDGIPVMLMDEAIPLDQESIVERAG